MCYLLDVSLNVLFVVDSCAYCAYCVLTGCIDIHLTVLQCVLTIAHFEMCCNVLWCLELCVQWLLDCMCSNCLVCSRDEIHGEASKRRHESSTIL
jgi:hypothetical protein